MNGEGSIPSIAVHWIISKLLPHRDTDYFKEHFQKVGLDALTVKELKMVGDIVHAKTAALEVPTLGNYSQRKSLSSSAKKASRVQFVRQAFYKDIACTEVNQGLLEELVREIKSGGLTNCQQQQQQQHSHTLKRPNQVSTATTNSKIERSTCQQINSNQNLQCNNNNLQGKRSVENSTDYQHTKKARNDKLVSSFNPCMSNTSSTLAGQQVASRISSPAEIPTRIADVKPEYQPSAATFGPNALHCDNEKESRLLNELLLMGFPDRREILNGIRQSGSNTADGVMIWIVSQREEAEEARKMDEARLRSEGLRKEQAEKVAQANQQKIDSATIAELPSLFPKSWILKIIHSPSHLGQMEEKYVIVKLLELEKKSMQWYGTELPSFYFKELAARLLEDSGPGYKSWLKGECELLETSLYKLEEQVGGVPKLFRRKQEQLEANVASEDIAIIDGRRAMRNGCAKISGIRKSGQDFEVIELD